MCIVYVLDPLFRRFVSFGKIIDEQSKWKSFDDSSIALASSIITTILVSILPVVCILVLYQIQEPYGRIGAAFGFTAAFALVVTLCTKARKFEVLFATAA